MKNNVKLTLLFTTISILGFAKNRSEHHVVYNLYEKNETTNQLYIVNNNYFFCNKFTKEFCDTIKLDMSNVKKVNVFFNKEKIDSLLTEIKDNKKEEINGVIKIDLNKGVEVDLSHLKKDIK